MAPSRRSAVPSFSVMDVLARADALRAQGRSVLTLCVGEPGGGAPAPVRAAAVAALAGDLGYTQVQGLPALREAVAGHCAARYGVAVDPARILMTTGASGAVLAAVVAAFDAGDRVAVASPGYPAYRNALAALGCEVVDVAAGPDARYALTLEALRETHARGPLAGVVIASPSNPTGTLTTELPAILAWCREQGVRCVSDEIYHGIVYDGAVAATAAGDPAALTIGSFSKYWGMTGWRLGWLVMPPDLARATADIAGNLALCAPVPAQHAALAAFDPASYVECDARVAALAGTREVLLAAAPSLGFTRVAPVDGAFYLWAEIGAAGLDSPTWCERLLADTGVALAPGTDFDLVDGERWVRLSFSPGREVVAAACERIAEWNYHRR
ncbi:pyridoxal phosphate-dependent aminotransferase [Litorihabitans aurantiacus]|uniref:Aminotransferase n=1 Tax=Litorihabitans aurantiacus TaxID=1930061 RepID=A0AA37XDW6_9MICO|nr:aminotransferase class I/II-fold pyridoxal phosphate-dependent enzyme [Litorihabitans aurantiacus]GMA31367.1 aminotransferase [Litorihabitans aurantiacus]